MADLKDRFGNFDGESMGHQQWPADILAEEFQPAKDVDVPPNNAEIETIARANIAVGGNAVDRLSQVEPTFLNWPQSRSGRTKSGNTLTQLPPQRCPHCRRWIWAKTRE
jgi:hypothetical protein